MDDLGFLKTVELEDKRVINVEHQRRRKHPPVVVDFNSPGSPPSDLLVSSSRSSNDGHYNNPFEKIVWDWNAVQHSQEKITIRVAWKLLCPADPRPGARFWTYSDQDGRD